MSTDWFRPRRYKHFDRPVNEAFAAKVESPGFVVEHSFSPLLHYVKKTKRYKPDQKKTIVKERPIMYPSHRDACILSYYSFRLNEILDNFYVSSGLNDNIVAYRSLGKGNYDFSASAFRFAVENAPCTILAFDVSGFFDNLDHGLLKGRLKRVLDVKNLPLDWFRVFRFVTKFHYVDLDELKQHTTFGPAVDKPGTDPIATIAEIKAAGIGFHPNKRATAGIPQGTPISATLSNLYMLDFDLKTLSYCQSIGAFYRRYSDDILIICPSERAAEAEQQISQLVASEKLQLSVDKTERTFFDTFSSGVPIGRCAQYLGFAFYPDGAGIRASSLSRQWRKMKRSLKRTRRAGAAAIAAGKANIIYTKKLRRRFSPLQFRNFSSYGRRGARAFGKGEKITMQVRRLERAFDREIRNLTNSWED